MFYRQIIISLDDRSASEIITIKIMKFSTLKKGNPHFSSIKVLFKGENCDSGYLICK